MKKFFTVLCMLVIALALQAQNDKLRVAVFDPTSSSTSIDSGTKEAVREIVSSTFVNTGKYIMVERSLLQQVMKEQKFSNTDVVDESQATELGRLAGANKVVLSVVSLVGGRNMLSIKVIDVKTATIDQQKTKVVSSNDLLDFVEPLTLELLGEKASTGTVVQSSSSTPTQNNVAPKNTQEVSSETNSNDISFYFEGCNNLTEEVHGEIPLKVLISGNKFFKGTQLGGGTLKEGFSFKHEGALPMQYYFLYLDEMKVGNAIIKMDKVMVDTKSKKNYKFKVFKEEKKGKTYYNFVLN